MLEVPEYEDNKESIEKISKMNLSHSFRTLFDEMIDAMKEKSFGKFYSMVENLYPSVKLEEELTDEEKSYVKDFLTSL